MSTGEVVASAVCWLSLSAYFAWYAGGGLRAHFSPDDMMNLHDYWLAGWQTCLKSVVLFWSPLRRPLLAAYYLSLYDTVHFSVLPYRIVLQCLNVVNIGLLASVFWTFTRDRWMTAVGLSLWVFHPALFLAYYSNAISCDVLCMTFYLAALLLYVRARSAGQAVTASRLAAISMLFILGLGAKEMAAPFPFILALLECSLYWQPGERLGQRAARFVPVAVTGGIVALYVVGRMTGPNAVASMEPFHPTLSAAVWMKSVAWYTGQLLHIGETALSPWLAVSGWAVLIGVTIWARSRLALFAVVFPLASLLPVAFIGLRESYVWYIPMVGPALYVAIALRTAARHAPVLRWAIPALLPFFLFPPGTMAVKQASLLQAQSTTWNFLEQVRTLPMAPQRGASVLVVDEPFGGFYDVYFILRLYFNDPTLRVAYSSPGSTQVKANVSSTYDNVLQFKDGRLVVLEHAPF